MHVKHEAKESSHKEVLILSIGIRYLGRFSVDIYNIALPVIFASLPAVVSYQTLKLSVTIYFLASAVSQLLSGFFIQPANINRVFGATFLCLIIGLLFCIVSTSINLLILGRFLQGLAIGVLPTMMGYLLSETPEYKKYIVIRGIFAALAPATGMLIAGILLSMFGWKSTFLFLLALSIGIYCYYSFNVKHRKALSSFSKLNSIQCYYTVLKKPPYLSHIIAISFSSAGFIIFFVNTPFLLNQTYNFHIIIVGLISVFVALFISFGRIIVFFLQKKVKGDIIIFCGLFLQFCAGFLFMITAMTHHLTLFIFLGLGAIQMIGYGIITPSITVKIIELTKSISVPIGLSLMGFFISFIVFLMTLFNSMHYPGNINMFTNTLFVLLAIPVVLKMLTFKS
ncbi:MFS transporter [Legionella busanensis]|nr:MFS transporter [Legionella busanensis]